MFFIILGIASLKGCLCMAPEAEGGVGGFFFWNSMLGTKQQKAIIASIIISLKVIVLPY
jgi:hypothetical protein